jgi:hypothetical protein
MRKSEDGIDGRCHPANFLILSWRAKRAPVEGRMMSPQYWLQPEPC